MARITRSSFSSRPFAIQLHWNCAFDFSFSALASFFPRPAGTTNSPGAFGALPHAIRNAGLRGVGDDTARTAREITAMVGDYYTKHGGQLLRSEKKPKILAAR